MRDTVGVGGRLSEFRPGHVFWMPRGATWLNRDKARPFVMTTPCKAGSLGTLAYGSTRATEESMGAVSIRVDPLRAGVNRNGLTQWTSFFPGILVRDRYEVLPAHAGTLGKRLDALRGALHRALGIGRGSCLAAGAPPGSRRGRIVRLEWGVARGVRTPFAVLLTEAAYSRADRYHVILPILRDTGQTHGPGVLRLGSKDWLAVFPQPTSSVFLPIPATHSIWYEAGVVRETEYVLDEDSLEEIDRALCAFFSLPMPARDE